MSVLKIYQTQIGGPGLTNSTIVAFGNTLHRIDVTITLRTAGVVNIAVGNASGGVSLPLDIDRFIRLEPSDQLYIYTNDTFNTQRIDVIECIAPDNNQPIIATITQAPAPKTYQPYGKNY